MEETSNSERYFSLYKYFTPIPISCPFQPPNSKQDIYSALIPFTGLKSSISTSSCRSVALSVLMVSATPRKIFPRLGVTRIINIEPFKGMYSPKHSLHQIDPPIRSTRAHSWVVESLHRDPLRTINPSVTKRSLLPGSSSLPPHPVQ